MKNHWNIPWIAAAPALLLVIVIGAATAGQVTVPRTFTPGTVADANQVNECFAALAAEVNDNDARIAQLEQELANHQSTRGMALAGVQVNVWDEGGRQAAVFGFNNLPGHSAPTLTRLAPGQYEVDFGASVDDHVYMATIGTCQYIYLPGQSPVTPFAHMVKAVQTARGSSKVMVTCYDLDGRTVDTPVFLAIF